MCVCAYVCECVRVYMRNAVHVRYGTKAMVPPANICRKLNKKEFPRAPEYSESIK